MAIRYKLGLIVGGLSFIILSMFLLTWYTTSAQKADGLVINLAGRQRMLSQKMSKELFLFVQQKDEKAKAAFRAAAQNTMAVFDVTLSALKDSGTAPLSLDINGPSADCPKAVEPAFSQLENVKVLWDTFSDHMGNALSGGDNAQQSLAFIKSNNIALLKEMNAAVIMLQKLSEKKNKTTDCIPDFWFDHRYFTYAGQHFSNQRYCEKSYAIL